jgi:hypothetical protein
VVFAGSTKLISLLTFNLLKVSVGFDASQHHDQTKRNNLLCITLSSLMSSAALAVAVACYHA